MSNKVIVKIPIVIFLIGVVLLVNIANIPYQEAQAGWMSDLKKSVKKMEKSNEDIEDMADCADQNLEKTLFYNKQGKIYIANPDCDPDKQWKYDKLNQQSGINEYEDKENFIVGLNFDEDEDEDDKDDNDDDKDDKDEDEDD